jgi:cytosine/adenosine deaminase-related metal-dependent hydrolase
MSEPTAVHSLRARWVIPIAGPPIEGGIVTLRGSHIVAVGREASGGALLDLGDAAILPGWVNAHTHLEFSDLAAPLGSAGMPLPTWIRAVVARRRAADAKPASAVLQGLHESLAAGVTALGEIATTDWRSALAAHGTGMPEVQMFFELIAARSDRVPAAAAAAQAFLQAAAVSESIGAALSPHAPYTVHPELLRQLITLSQQSKVPLAMHLAESPEELELLATGGGPFADMLRDFGAWQAGTSARLPRIRNYLEHLARAPRALVVHGNYLADDEIEFLAQHAATMSVVYCPRTHDYFGHAPYPLARMLDAGVPMALGTDSRSSNPDLDLLAEMRFVRDHHPALSAQQIVRLGTIDGARALGFANRLGTLSVGKLASLAVVQLPANPPADPCEAVLADESRVIQTWMAGAPVPH